MTTKKTVSEKTEKTAKEKPRKLVHVYGKRKTSVARATLYEGKGIIRINKQLLDTYTPALGKMMIEEPLMIAGDVAKKIDININVFGGGWHSQAEASRICVARALVEYTKSKDLRQQYINYDRNMLISDVRFAERSKPNDSKPRSKRQKSYR